MEKKKKEIAEAFVEAVNHPKCTHEVGGVECGLPAVCVIKTHAGKLGMGSLWESICTLHKGAYPDHEGFELDGSQKLS